MRKQLTNVTSKIHKTRKIHNTPNNGGKLTKCRAVIVNVKKKKKKFPCDSLAKALQRKLVNYQRVISLCKKYTDPLEGIIHFELFFLNKLEFKREDNLHSSKEKKIASLSIYMTADFFFTL